MNNIPSSFKEATERIIPLIKAIDENKLKEVDDQTFLTGWAAIAFLYPGLHPDSVNETNDLAVTVRHEHVSPIETMVDALEPRLVAPHYEDSGWPCVLLPVLNDAWRRYEGNDEALYQCDAQRAGMECDKIE